MSNIPISDAKLISDDARRFAAMFAGFIKASEAFDRIVSLEQAIAESESRLIANREQEAAVKAKVNSDAKAIIDDAHKRAIDLAAEINGKLAAVDQDISKKHAIADEEIAGKWAVHRKKLAEETAAASQVLDEQRRKDNLEQTELRTELAKLRTASVQGNKDLATLNAEIETKHAQLQELDVQFVNSSKRLADLNAEIARLRAKF